MSSIPYNANGSEQGVQVKKAQSNRILAARSRNSGSSNHTRPRKRSEYIDSRGVFQLGFKEHKRIFGYGVESDDSPTAASISKRTIKPRVEDKLQNDGLCILIEREYTPIHKIKDPRVFWDVFIHCVICSHTLYSKGGILHRDISINNLAHYFDEDDKPIGVIMDFDLVSIGRAKPSSRVRSGMAPFMARDLLDPKNESYTHQFHHELESFVYVLIWYTLGYRGKSIPSDDPLAKFRRGGPRDMFSAKRAFFLAEWDELFPTADCKSDKDLLRFFCYQLSSYYYEVSTSQKWVGMRAEIEEDAEIVRKWNESKGSTRTTVAPIPSFNPTDPRFMKVTFGIWLEFVGCNPEGFVCDKDCCVL